MKARLFIPGRFEDAYLYMKRLAIMDEDHALRILDLRRCISEISRGQEAVRLLLTYGLEASNAPGHDHCHTKLADNPELRTAVERLSRDDAALRFDTEGLQVEPAIYDIKVPADIVLDLSIYLRRLYLATNRGLFHLDINWDPPEALPAGELVKRLDAHCLSTSTKYATVSTSCGDDGLFASPDDFSLFEGGRGTKKLRRLADKSSHSAWLTQNLVNYQSHAALPSLFAGEVEEVQADRNLTRRVVTAFNADETIGAKLSDGLRKLQINPSDITYIHNANKFFLVQTRQGHLYGVKALNKNPADHSVLSATDHPSLEAQRILSAHSLRSGLVLETETQVLLWANGNLSTLVDTEVVAVRTFPASKDHLDVVTITTDDGVELIGIFGEDTTGSQQAE